MRAIVRIALKDRDMISAVEETFVKALVEEKLFSKKKAVDGITSKNRINVNKAASAV